MDFQRSCLPNLALERCIFSMYKVKDLVSVWEFSKQCWPIVTGIFQQLIYQDKEPSLSYLCYIPSLISSFYFFQLDGDGDFSTACYHVLESVYFPFRRIEVSILNPCEDWVNDKPKFSLKMILDTREFFEWEEIQVKGIGFCGWFPSFFCRNCQTLL